VRRVSFSKVAAVAAGAFSKRTGPEQYQSMPAQSPDVFAGRQKPVGKLLI
jgi:hypothetical protein